MKKLITSHNIPKLVLYIEVEEQYEDIAASTDFNGLQTFSGISKKHQLSEEVIQRLDDLIRSVLGSMEGRGFIIHEAKQSGKSYTFYIRFQPTDSSGKPYDQELMLQLELRDHVSSTHISRGAATPKLLIRSFLLKDKSYDKLFEVMKELWAIFDDLQNGDFSSFV